MLVVGQNGAFLFMLWKRAAAEKFRHLRERVTSIAHSLNSDALSHNKSSCVNKALRKTYSFFPSPSGRRVLCCVLKIVGIDADCEALSAETVERVMHVFKNTIPSEYFSGIPTMGECGHTKEQSPSLAVSQDVAELLEDPPETLPSFLVLNGGYWHCRK